MIIHSLCLTALQAANPDGSLWQSRVRLERNGTERNVPNVPVMPKNCSVWNHRSRFWDSAIVIITSDTLTAGIMYVLVGSGFSPPETGILMAMRLQCRHTFPCAVNYRVGDSSRCVWLGRGEGEQQRPHRWSRSISTAFRRCLSSFQCDIFIPSCWCVQVKNDPDWVRFKPNVTLDCNVLNNSPFKIWCFRNVSAPSARWHHVAYKHWVPEQGFPLLHSGAYLYHFWFHKMDMVIIGYTHWSIYLRKVKKKKQLNPSKRSRNKRFVVYEYFFPYSLSIA